tara:strand:+ start:525 stop:1031 length:507 start_codon:yes stop_codon:yes gene_type:complete
MELKTKKGESFFIDEEDYGKVKHINWRMHPKGYIFGWCTNDKVNIRLHRVLLNAPFGVIVDHIDHNPSNNMRSNIRLCTQSENLKNRRSFGRSSKYLGVSCWINRCKYHTEKYGERLFVSKLKIVARIKVGDKQINLGSFKTEEDAAHAYDEAAKKYHGEFANLNFKK